MTTGAVLGLALAAAALLSAGAAHAVSPDYEVVDQGPSDTLSNGVVVDSTYTGTAGNYGGEGHAFFYTEGTSEGSVTWTFSRPIRTVKLYYVNVNPGDDQTFSSNLGPVNFSPVADGGSLVSSAGFDFAGQPEGTYAMGKVTCGSGICSGSVELLFTDDVTSITSSGVNGPNAGFNDVGIALDVAQPDPILVPEITTSGVASAVVGTPYTATIAATGGSPLTFSLAEGDSLPEGLSLDETTGVISGIPTEAGDFTFTVFATNGGGSDEQVVTISVAPAAGANGGTGTAGNEPANGSAAPAGSSTGVTTGKLASTGVDTAGSILPAALGGGALLMAGAFLMRRRGVTG